VKWLENEIGYGFFTYKDENALRDYQTITSYKASGLKN